MTAFVVAGMSVGTASAAVSAATFGEPDHQLPGAVPTCLIPLPLLCEDPPDDDWSGTPAPQDSWSSAPAPVDSWSNAPHTPEPRESEPPWRPAGEREHRVPRGHPETGGGGLAESEPVWPFAVGGAALLAGGGLAGFAVRRRKDVA
ncbi:hypothetical protein [Nonomuraea solani]|uniref:hypothetical protein n=1 Tax=Nonomuraea solani TaxID=1144553 RepID=UPI000CDEFD6E|nr:hypothetical protein [Nonomuraea solani]